MVESIKKKQRLDTTLHERGLLKTRSMARSVIMAGRVYVDGQRVDKAGTLVGADSEIVLKDGGLRYVSRGGLKLEAALGEFGIDPAGMVAVDIGASTGGFTDCLLQHGALKVHAVDVGYGQLDWSLRNDARVRLLERTNARQLTPRDIGERVDIATVDVSFISLEKVIPPLKQILKPGGALIALIKPQFEVGKGEVGKGGVVRSEVKHKAVVDKIRDFLIGIGFSVKGSIPSPILGAEGNKEFLICAVVEREV